MMYFVGYAQFRLRKLKATKAYCNEEVRNYEKFYLSKALLKRADGRGGMHPHVSPPLNPPLTGTLLFQTDDSRVSQGRMRYVVFYSYGRTAPNFNLFIGIAIALS